jgi:enoyl-CoA hydratase/carnithine racemase
MDVSVEAGVALITLNRPDLRNAWDGATAREYRWALHWCHTNADVRVVVLTGEGDFCVGADAGALDDIGANGGDYEVKAIRLPDYPPGTPKELQRNHFYPLTLSTPVIAAIRGGCAGAGFLLATYSDIRFADPDARIASSFASLGLPAEYGSGWLLPRIVGVANAAQLLYNPEPISATRAAALGWVQHVSEPGCVVGDALQYARQLAAGSSAESLRTMKRQIFIDSIYAFGPAYQTSVDEMNAALRGADFRAGIDAVRSKTKPNFLAPSADDDVRTMG